MDRILPLIYMFRTPMAVSLDKELVEVHSNAQ